MTWYDAPSHTAGAALVARLAQSPGGMPDVDLRVTGLWVRSTDGADAVADLARPLGLRADPAPVRTIRFGMEAADPDAVLAFWQTVLGYERAGADGLVDPLRRGPALTVRRLTEPRPLRNRIHVDVVRPAEEVVRARAGREPTGPFGVMLPDAEGNEVDLVPGEPLPGTSDWQALFSAMTFYPTSSPAQLVTRVAELADGAGIPLLIDVRAEGVVIDSGKDAWEDADGGADPRFVALAAQIEAAAKDLGLQADPAPLRFVQFGIDALDVQKVRAFWMELLGYQEDPPPHVSDIYDPRRLNPVLFFQQLEEPREQRNRIHFELTGEDAGLLTDPEGNEVLITP
jgi:hypothetical protein